MAYKEQYEEIFSVLAKHIDTNIEKQDNHLMGQLVGGLQEIIAIRQKKWWEFWK